MVYARVRITVIAAILAAFALCVGAGRAAEGTDVSAADSAGIKKTLAAYDEAFNKHDPHGVSLTFAESADFMNMRGESHHGQKDIEAFFGSLFEVRLKDAHRTDTIKRLRLLAPDVIFMDADWEMTGTKAPDGKDNPLRKGLLMWVMSKQNGKWYITVFHEADL